MELSARSAYRGQVTKIIKSASEFLDSEESKPTSEELYEDIEEQLVVLKQRLTAAHDCLNTTNEEVRNKELIKSDLDKELEKVAEYQDAAIGMLSRLNSRIRKLQLRQAPSPSSPEHTSLNTTMLSRPHKLPKLPLKKFDGGFHEWLPFWEQFRAAVHENGSLTSADKFSYLESVLVGSAKKVIAGFTASGKCYEAAISLLQEQFGDNERLVDKNMQQLLSLRPIHSKTDAAGLRNLYNSITSSCRTLTALQIPSHQYNIMLKSILLRCLPVDLRIDYFRLIETDNAPASGETSETSDDSTSTLSLIADEQVHGIMKFLKREVESLERSRVVSIIPNAKSSTEATTATSLVSWGEKENICFFCGSEQHETKDCESNIPLATKRDKLRKSGRCFRCAKRGHSSKKCRSAKWLCCKKCKGKHLSSMCDPTFAKRAPEAAHMDNNNGRNALNLCAYNSYQDTTNVFLKTARGIAAAPSKNKLLLIRLIIDGGSQHSFVSESLVQKLGLRSIGCVNISVLPFGSKHPSPCQKLNKVRITIKSQFTEKSVNVEAVVVPNICVDVLPAPDTSASVFGGMHLADCHHVPLESEDGLSVLIGSDYYWAVVTGKQRRISASLRAVNTILGWTLQGPLSASGKNIMSNSYLCSSSFLSTVLDDNAIPSFWSLEAIGIRSEEEENKHATEHLTSTCIKKKGARYEAQLPWKDSDVLVGNNKEDVLKCLRSLIKRLSRNPSQLAEYDAAIKRMVLDGIAESVIPNKDVLPGRVFYLPHRPIYKSESTTTKMRIVFNASFRTEDVPSLNEQLHVGTNLLPDVLAVLLNFRLGQYGIVADVEKAFLQIMLSEKDRDCHRFIWMSPEKSPDGTLTYEDYRMTRVTFGVKSSPFILTATIQMHLSNQEDRFSTTCEVLRKGFYMDDLVTSVDTEDEGKRIYHEAVSIMSRASMNLRKWNSNSSEIRKAFGTDSPVKQKVLGLEWFVYSDEIAVPTLIIENLVTSKSSKVTKRVVLQTIARIFDPLGIVGPVVIRLKILFQSIWTRKLAWDQALPADLMCEWENCAENLLQLKDYTIPRSVLSASPHKISVHIFADASMKAYGTVAYIKNTYPSGESCISFFCAKSRVAPLNQDGTKELTLPKLELTAALIAARLCSYMKRSLKISVHKFQLWTDSKITLNWILGEVDRWKPYIQSRVNEIRRLTSTSDWNHCSGKENPADLLTRGITVESLKASSLWTQGPVWLKNADYSCVSLPISADVTSLVLPTETSTLNCEMLEPVLCYQRFSTWKRLLRVTGYILRFSTSCKKRERPPFVDLTAEELNAAEAYWLRYIQFDKFANEICFLQKERSIPKSSKISQLCPFLDHEGVLRLGGRLQTLNESTDFKHPIILPHDSYISDLIVKDYHQRTLHGGANLVLSQLRERFLILKGRPLVKKILKQCVICKKLWGKPSSQPFGPLPLERLTLSRPFDNVGVDFAGPLYCFDHSNGEMSKTYFMIFTCAAIRSVHLELVTNMTTESCLMALRRFIARRGVPSVIFSDNARTFRRAALELEGTAFEEQQFQSFLSTHRIRWKFIVERAPWWGGFWERLIRSIKNVLKVVVGRAKLTFEQLRTILAEAEAMVNARPLTYLSSEPINTTALTPAHFLLSRYGTPKVSEGETGFCDIQKLWKQRMRYTAMLRNRWRSEYMQLLRSFHHSKGASSEQLKPNDVVLVFDSAKPRINWKMAIVENAYNGRDGKVRACEIRYSDGTRTRRPVQLLYPLELAPSGPAGGC